MSHRFTTHYFVDRQACLGDGTIEAIEAQFCGTRFAAGERSRGAGDNKLKSLRVQITECHTVQILVNTDSNIKGGTELVRLVENVVEGTLARFGDRITRVEVHLTDENSRQKSADNDKRCAMEARLAGLQPLTVTTTASTLEQAVDGAAEKLEKLLQRTLDRLDDPKGRTSFAGDQS